jgi:hypothetical protein
MGRVDVFVGDILGSEADRGLDGSCCGLDGLDVTPLTRIF